jgi:hypothetical protein
VRETSTAGPDALANSASALPQARVRRVVVTKTLIRTSHLPYLNEHMTIGVW